MSKDSSIWVADSALIIVINDLMRPALLYLVKSSITYLGKISCILSVIDILVWIANLSNSTFEKSTLLSLSLSAKSIVTSCQSSAASRAMS